MNKTIRFWIAAVVLLICQQMSYGQNLQIHYDMGRKSVTTTAEMFRADNCGSTFFFIDLDYNPRVSGAYWEISRARKKNLSFQAVVNQYGRLWVEY